MLSCLVLNACTTQYTANVARDILADMRLRKACEVNRSAEWTLHPNTRLYLARGAFSNPAKADAYPRLSSAVFDALAHNLARVFPATGVAVERQSLLNALAEARIADAQILVYPSLVSLSDEFDSLRELSEGSTVHPDKYFAPDKLAFKVVLVDVATGNIVDTALVSARGKMLTLENDGPTALLPYAALAYVEQISGGKFISSRI